MGRLAIGLRVGSLGRPFWGAGEHRSASETMRVGFAHRPFQFQEINPGYQQVIESETLKKFLLLVGSLVFMLLFAEAALRFFPLLRSLPRTYVGDYDGHQVKRSWLVANPSVGWKVRPNFLHPGVYHINAQGFRAPSDFDPSQACKAIAFAGDSVTFGVGVRSEKTFASLVQAGTQGTCAYNMGIPGFGLDQMWLMVRTQALPLHPRLVVVTFNVGDLTRSQEAYNPISDLNKPVFKLAEGRLVPETAEDRPGFLVRFLQHHSSIWRVVRLADRTLAHHYPHGEWWYLNAAILDAIREDCRKAGVPVLFVYVPSRGGRAFPSLRSYMLRNQANFIDLSRGEFALAPDMYLQDDDLNDKGNQRVADAVLRWAQAISALGVPQDEGMLAAGNSR